MTDENHPDNGVEDLGSNEWVSDLLGMDYDRYLEYKEHATQGMLIFGDKFVEALGFALSEADDRNAVKLMRLFRNECSSHEMIYRMHQAKEKALGASA